MAIKHFGVWKRVTRIMTSGVMLVGLMLVVADRPVSAQSSLRIAATVNDEMISVFDISGRMTLAIFLSKLPNTQETRKRLAPQILRGIIDDKLRMQAAKRQNISVSLTELGKGIADWERRSGLAKGGSTSLAKQLGIDKSVITEQVETNVAWRKLLRSQFLSSIRLTDKEIDDILAEEESRRGEPEFQVSEIYLPFGRAAAQGDAAQLATRLIGQIRNGAPFSAVARNFSQSPTAAVGGSLGWVRRGELPPELDQIIQRLSPSQVSSPIRTLDGIYILTVSAKRSIEPFLERSSGPATATIYQIHLEYPANAPASVRAERRAAAAALGAQARSCKDMAALGEQHGSSLSGSPGKLLVSQLSQKIQSAIANLPDLTASQPIDIADGALIVMVCERTKPTVKKIDRDALRNKIRVRLLNERMTLTARQFLRSLRRAAIVDIRI